MSSLPAPEKYFKLLALEYPTTQALYTEIINLQAILNLPKGTEHFISDIHGEHKAFSYILNSCSGVIESKVNQYFKGKLTARQMESLCGLIHYPIDELKRLGALDYITVTWYRDMLNRLIPLAKFLSSKYTRSKVKKALPTEFAYIIDELMHAQNDEEENQQIYHEKIIDTLIDIGSGNDFITSLCNLIKRLAVDRLHILGDIFDRGPRPDLIMDMLLQYHSIDFTWGNHDILWMGAAAGNLACIAAVVYNSLAYGNSTVIETGYGISLRSLYFYAGKEYPSLGVALADLVSSDMIYNLEFHEDLKQETAERELWKVIASYGYTTDFDSDTSETWMKDFEGNQYSISSVNISKFTNSITDFIKFQIQELLKGAIQSK